MAKLRYGIVGAGMMGREHLYNLSYIEDAEVVAIADPFEPSRRAAVEIASGIQVFDHHKALLNASVCDVVIVSSPNMTHAAILLDILGHPKAHHVLVEKPLCTSIEDCNKVLEASKLRPDILVQVGLEYRYMPPVAELIKLVRAGTIGPVRMVSIREHRFPFLVKVHNWNRFNANTGGTLVEKCCHFFDLMNLIVASEPLRVYASGAQDVNHLNEVYDGKVPDILDNAYVIVDYKNGARCMLDLCMFAEGSKNEQEISVVGDRGKVEALVPENVVRLGQREDGRERVQTLQVTDSRIKYQGLHHGSSYLEHLEFMEAAKSHGKRVPTVSLQDGLMSVAIGIAAQKSIECRQSIELKETLSTLNRGLDLRRA